MAYSTTTEQAKLYPYTSIMASPYSGDPTGVVNCAAAIESIKANQSNIGTIYIPKGTFRIGTNLSIPAGMALEFAAGAYFSIDAGITLTLPGPVVAPDGQSCFIGSGVLSLGTSFPSTSTTKILQPGTWAVTTNTTIPANIVLRPRKGAILTISTGVTLTINGPLEAGWYQIFSWAGTGTVAYGNLVPEVYPEWYGAIPDNSTDSVTYLQKALDTHSVVHLGKGIYKITTELYPKENGTLYGDGPQSILYRSTTVGGSYVGGLLPYNYVTLRNFTLRGSGAAYVAGADGIAILYYNGAAWVDPGSINTRSHTDMTKWRGAHLTVENLIVEDWAANGIGAGPWSIIKDVVIQDTLNEGMLLAGNYTKVVNPSIYNVAGWGIDINASYVSVLGGYLYNCGDETAWTGDMGGILIASHTQTTGAVGNKIVGVTIDTSDGPAILVYSPLGYDYALTDTIIDSILAKNICVDSVDVNLCAIDIVDNSTSGTKLDRVNINNVIIDTTTVGHGIGVLGARNVSIDNYHIKSAAARGIFIYSGTGNFEGINVGKGTIKNCGTDGIHATNGSKLDISGYNISNSAAPGTYYGIYLANVTKFNIGSGVIDLDTTGAKAPTGIYLTGTTGHGTISGAYIANTDVGVSYDATGNYVSIIGNEFSTSNTVKASILGTNTYCVLANNVGGDVVTPAVPASTVEARNTFTHPVRVTIVGGTVTVIAKGPTSGALIITGATTGSFVLEPNEYIAITYTVVPAWLWAGM